MNYFLIRLLHLELESAEPFAANSPENWLFGISPEGIGTLGMLLNFLVTIVISRLTPEPPNDVQKLVENIRIPRELEQYNK